MDLVIAIIDDDDICDAATLLMESYEWDVSVYESSSEFFYGFNEWP